MTARKNPPLLVRSDLTGRIHVVNRYTREVDGHLISHEKFDVTAQFNELVAEQARTDRPYTIDSAQLDAARAQLHEALRLQEQARGIAALLEADNAVLDWLHAELRERLNLAIAERDEALDELRDERASRRWIGEDIAFARTQDAAGREPGTPDIEEGQP